ncbi:hypothetical protein [Cryptosporangium sp. NPDC051539]|uniref:hypothetical protein n=1 Tax=Cryptosporangium sp. NPDC051539 TaxID=3363962 RepID=UPI0037AF8076
MTRSRGFLAVAIGAVLAVIVLVVALVHRGDPSGPSSDDDTAAAPSATTAPATSAPACLPTVTESGFYVERSVVLIGLTVTNRCPQALAFIDFTTRLRDSTGRALTPGEGSEQPDLPIILAGQTVGLAATAAVASDAKITSIQVSVTDAKAVRSAVNLPTATVTPLTHDRDGSIVEVHGTLRADPNYNALCAPQVNVLVRDRAGKLLYARAALVRGPDVVANLRPPATADLDRLEASIVQGKETLDGRVIVEGPC